MTENVIPIDDETSRFYNYLSYNERIMFSAQFGDGKTFFLNHFFDNYKEEIYCVKIYPVNYQVEDNKDIFELIKKDILIQLFASNELQEEEIIDTSLHAQYYLFNKGEDIILDLLSCIPYTKTPVEFVQKCLKHLSKYRQNKKESQKGIQDLLEDYFKGFSQKPGSCEYDTFSSIITKCVNTIKKKGKKVVCLIEDLDRIDPAHIFRILNILTAHIDRVNALPDEGEFNQQNNKFNFDNIILACHYENIKSIFEHFYGSKTHFDGYIRKFFSTNPFHYSLNNAKHKYKITTLSKLFNCNGNEFLNVSSIIKKMRDISIRDFICYTSELEKEIKPGFIPVIDKYKISTINTVTLLLVFLRRLEIPTPTITDFNNWGNNKNEIANLLFNIVGVCWFTNLASKIDKLNFPTKNTKNWNTSINIPVNPKIDKKRKIIIDIPYEYVNLDYNVVTERTQDIFIKMSKYLL
ncbi:P-loop NTPase fold protein [uncultured Sanguibacteroides sp.]|uniref:P-loop NTPase fold protein n=1 Tax=uncultured Sanguibacteroides sp. TaxID=1635151 RepID=UPI0025EC2046|nr:P-loop NTPase fold protein [uncultured Sanguibacteroides sp.]